MMRGEGRGVYMGGKGGRVDKEKREGREQG